MEVAIKTCACGGDLYRRHRKWWERVLLVRRVWKCEGCKRQRRESFLTF